MTTDKINDEIINNKLKADVLQTLICHRQTVRLISPATSVIAITRGSDFAATVKDAKQRLERQWRNFGCVAMS